MSVKIAYFAHDLTDPAVHRRMRMFALGGAVNFRDEIVGGFFIDANGVELIHRASNRFAGFAGGLESDGEHRLHEAIT